MNFDCPSSEHRAALGLLGVALGEPPKEALLFDLANSDPVKLAAIANVGHVHSVLASAKGVSDELAHVLPEDLWLYFSEMQEANITRQQRGRLQLKEIGRLFHQNGISGVVLKGGAELLDPLCDPTHHRFVGDLDILIPEKDAEQAQKLLKSFGGYWDDYSQVTSSRMHHKPAVLFDDWEYPVEIHLKVGGELVSRVLQPQRVYERSIPSSIMGLFVPSLADRYLHHVLHSQQDKFEQRDIYLRAILDQNTFVRVLDEETRQALHQTLDTHGLKPIAEAMDAQLWAVIPSTTREPVLTAQTWLKSALKNVGQPSKRKWREMTGYGLGYIGRFLSQPDYRRYYLRMIVSKSGWKQFNAANQKRFQRIK